MNYFCTTFLTATGQTDLEISLSGKIIIISDSSRDIDPPLVGCRLKIKLAVHQNRFDCFLVHLLPLVLYRFSFLSKIFQSRENVPYRKKKKNILERIEILLPRLLTTLHCTIPEISTHSCLVGNFVKLTVQKNRFGLYLDHRLPLVLHHFLPTTFHFFLQHTDLEISL